MRVYEWTEDEDDVALDSITVGISSDSRILTVAGLQFGQREALVYWPDWLKDRNPVAAGIEGPMPVEIALTRAETLRAKYGFKRVFVWVQHRELWDDRWGNLAPTQSQGG